MRWLTDRAGELSPARAHKRDFTDIDAQIHKHGAAHAQFTPGGVDVVVGAMQQVDEQRRVE